MTNRIELNWKLNYLVDQYKYYCSESPININNLPLHKAILSGNINSYIDNDIETGKIYYVRIGSIKNGIEKISDQIICDTTLYKIKTIFINGINDESVDNIVWTNNGTVLFDNNGANFDSLSKYLQCSTNFDLNSDFKIVFEILFKSFERPSGVSAGDSACEIISNANAQLNTSSYFFGISVILDGNNWGGVDRSIYFGISNVYAVDTTKALTINKFYKIELENINKTIVLKIDDEVIGTKINAPEITNTNTIRLGSTQRWSNGFGNYVIKNLMIKQ